MHPRAVPRSIAWLAGAALVAMLATACEHSPMEHGVVASIVVTRNPDTLAIGTARQFTATGRDADGNVVGIDPTWSVAAGGGTIGTTGIFTAGTVTGTFNNTVVASVGSISGRATVTVVGGPAASITVVPNPVTLTADATQQFTAVVKDASGNVLTTAPNWSVAAGGGTIDGAGLFTAGPTAGSYPNTVTASVGSVKGTASVTVTGSVLASVTVTPNPAVVPTGSAQQFTATGRDVHGNVVAFTPNWSVQAGGGSINAAGVFTAGTVAGIFTNTVRACTTPSCAAGSMAGFATVTVTAGGLQSISVLPNPATVAAGGTQQFTAVGRDADGNVVATPGLAWSVVAGGGSINSGSGLFTAGAVAGTYTNTVRAASGTHAGTATVIVTAGPPPPPPGGITLGAAATHGILAGSAVSCASAPGIINADVSVWPGIAITGFPPCTINGQRHAGDVYAQNAQEDLTTAYLALQAMPCGTTITSDLGGTTLAPGVYCSGSSVGVTGVVTLSGPSTAVFVIKAPSTLTTAGSVVMAGGAQAKNVYWWVGSSATLGTGSNWQGNIVAFTSITLVDNVTLVGRALARNGAVSLGTGSVITLP
ncbi:MAG: putative immunogloblin [Gemmatimonadetes bacterium]|nr:putative immunogloblin [Gemmatimonadota bacterium]